MWVRLEPAEARNEARRLVGVALEDEGIERALGGNEVVERDVTRHVIERLLLERSLRLSMEELAGRRWEVAESKPSRRLAFPLEVSNWIVSVLGSVAGIVFGLLALLVASIAGTDLVTALVGALGVAATLFAAVSFQLPRMRRRLEVSRRARLEAVAGLNIDEAELIEAVRAEVRVRLNELDDPAFSTELTPTDARGLRDPFDPKYEVSVRVTEILRNTLKGLEAGSVGIAGPRGVGKTTLIRAACEGRLAVDDEDDRDPSRPHPQGLLVSAPVRYGAQDFVRFLFARLCLAVLSPSPQQERLELARAERRELFELLLGISTVAVISISGVLLVVGGVIVDPAAWVGILVMTGCGAFLLLGLGRLLERRRALRDRIDEDPLAEEARGSLEQLRYLETRSEEWAVQMSAKAATLARKRGVSRSTQAWTFPETIERYRRFLAQLAREEPIVIGIDELDKIATTEEACGFLNEMKSLFDQPDVYYLVSVSEDALSAFERRGQPIRDVFDSAFNDIIRVDYLSRQESELLLRRRAIGIPPPWPALIHCLAGGLPREAIRIARRADQIAEHEGRDLATVTLALAAGRMAELEHAATVVARQEVFSDGTQPLLTWLRALPPVESSITHGSGDGQSAVEMAKAALRRRMRVEGVVAEVYDADPGKEGIERLERLTMELAASAHHALTWFEFFAELSERRYEQARSPEADGIVSLELLARGQQDLSASPALSWQTVKAFRERVGLEPHPYPATTSVPS